MIDDSPRALAGPARRFAAVAAIGLIAASAVALDATPAEAAGRYTAHAHAQRRASAKATVLVRRTAKATKTVSVAGYAATATAQAQAAQRVTAKRSARASASAKRSGPSQAKARARARQAAAKRAQAQAHKKAQHLAAQAARQKASAQAYQRAKAQAAQQAQQQATLDATQEANQAKQGVTDPGNPTGGNPPVTTTIGSTTTSGAPGTGSSTAPITVGTSTGSGSLGLDVGVNLGGTTVSLSAGLGPCGGQTPPKPGGGTWTCSFDDEFNGTSLDTTKWLPQTTSASNFRPGEVCYIDDPSTISESGGYLNLTVNKTAPFSCPTPKGAFTTSYTGGTVSTFTHFGQTYGRFEVRAKLPPATVAGLQETLWLWPQDALKYGVWPASGEIDFAEFYSQYAGWTIPYLHYTYDQSTASWATNTNVVTALPAPNNQPGMNCQIDQSAFNTYLVTWLPGLITITVNGQDCIVDNYQPSNVAAPAPFDQPFFVALTQALGTGTDAPTADTPLPATTQVDYVRVWK